MWTAAGSLWIGHVEGLQAGVPAGDMTNYVSSNTQSCSKALIVDSMDRGLLVTQIDALAVDASAVSLHGCMRLAILRHLPSELRNDMLLIKCYDASHRLGPMHSAEWNVTCRGCMDVASGTTGSMLGFCWQAGGEADVGACKK